MGTVLLRNHNSYVKRFYGGLERGVSYSIKIDGDFTRDEFKDLLEDLHNALEAEI